MSAQHQSSGAFAAANATWNLVAETRFFASCCAFASYGAGLSIVDPITAADCAARGLVARRFAPRIPYEVGLLFPSDRVRPLLVDDFVTALKRHLAPFLSRHPASTEPAPAGG